ncbi:MAG: ATP-binding cassette domain-containing protein [Chlorobi bacterium]|nr:ATP-binding cassette domain-containing protein [Chlorobiota bacterium]
MISVNRALVQFGGFTLFKDVSFVINRRDKIGLVGKNGAGKSTLLKIIAQKQSLSAGQLSLPKEIIIGYLPQQMKLHDNTSVFKETLSVFAEILEIEKRIEKINVQLAERTDYESNAYNSLIHELTELNEKFHISGGNNINEEVEKILLGLGFLPSDFERQTNEFSGGWRMRIELAKILLKKPDVLLLDEPTNHLDIMSIEWLEELLKDYKGAVMLVSHDRRFLDNVTQRTIEISAGKAYDYKVSYSKFIQLRKERREQQVAAFKNQQKMIQDAEKFIERFRYKATKAVQVQSRIKQLEKIERIEIDEEDYSNLHFKFTAPPRSGNLVLEIKQLSKSYDDLLVLDKVDLIIERGEKISFVGRNGEGKTTLSKVIVGQLPYTGNLKVGHNVKIGYYAQNQAELLNESKTVFETIDHIAVGEVRTKIRNILGTFLFKGEDAEKKVEVLSGGERARLALACLLLEPYNLLILDEPTNHLDIRSKDVLKQALLDYTGTIIIVSHDRDFLDGLTDKVFEFKNKKLREHLGGINNFLRKNKLENLNELNRKKSLRSQSKQSSNKLKNESYEERKKFEKKIRKLKKSISNSESKINELEKKLESLNNLFNNSFEELNDEKKYEEYQQIQEDLEKEMENWSNFQEELEKLKPFI